MACQEGHSKIVETLLAAAGIQVNQANNDGKTPFMSAVSKSHTVLLSYCFYNLERGIGHNNINEWFHIDKPEIVKKKECNHATFSLIHFFNTIINSIQ